jgi:SAM-dependent methyltransferase
MKQVFTKIYEDNFWRNPESVSGHGSTLKNTKYLREMLPEVLRAYNIRSVLDIPCGDLNWAKHVQWPKYIGADIVTELVAAAKAANPTFDLRVLDITKDELPKVDLILCRDLLVHFSNADVKRALKNIRASGAKFLLATTFPLHENSGDIETGQWRPLNLGSLWGLGSPLEYISEEFKHQEFSDKSLGLWRL